MTSFISSLIGGIVAGVISAGLFHVILKHSVPDIKISENIEKRTDSNGKITYHIKVVNLKKRFVVNVKPYLYLEHEEGSVDGKKLRSKILTIYDKTVPFLYPLDEKDDYKKYATRVELTEDLEKEWHNDNKYHLVVQLYGEDAFSGAGKMFTVNYYKMSTSIIEGEFKVGTSTEIV